MVIAEVPQNSQVKLNGEKALKFGNKVLIGFHRDEKPYHEMAVLLPNGQNVARKIAVEQRQYETQHIKGLPNKMVTPPKEVYERIAADIKAVKQARAEIRDNCNLEEGWIMPTEGVITGVYGSARVLNGKPKQPHYGVDIAAKKGTAVKAPMSGVVTLNHPDMYYTGKTMIINHGCGLTSTFIHLSDFDVKEGEFVKQGQVVARVGSTGRSTGPHLDWRVNLLDKRLDPSLLVD